MSDQLYRLTNEPASTDLCAIVEHEDGDYLLGRLVPVEPDYQAAGRVLAAGSNIDFDTLEDFAEAVASKQSVVAFAARIVDAALEVGR